MSLFHYLRTFASRSKRNIETLITNIAVINGVFASLYYVIFSRDFDREHISVLKGKLQYKKNLEKTSGSSVLLRRNIHRLEKGLIAKNQRKVFGLSYINETIKVYSDCLNSVNQNTNINEEIQWAHDVLEKFFSIVEKEPKVDYAKKIFNNLKKLENKQKYPYKRDLKLPLSVSYEQFLKLAERRRSVRWYLQKKVPREIIDKALHIASLSPSACNRQPFKYIIFDKTEDIKQIASIPMGTAGFSDNFPGVIVLVTDLSAFFHERDRHLIYIDTSLSVMSFMYALETLGISSCAINWPDIVGKEKILKKELNLSKHERVIMFISYGYPDPEGKVPYSQKKPLSQIRTYASG